MSDDLKKSGKQDRARVSKQKHEIDYLMKKFGHPRDLTIAVVAFYGPMRTKVEPVLGEYRDNNESKRSFIQWFFLQSATRRAIEVW